MIYFRYLLAAPGTFVLLSLFGLYFGGLRRIKGRWMKYPLALFVGVPMAVANVTFNLTFGTFIFLRLPPLRNGAGEFSPYFSTRISHYREIGHEPWLVEHIVDVVQQHDPRHFGGV